ncbi:hypothetical protein Forpe1208_v003466 [Fusarium oxysporum f. sp. rapae]|uniref:Uncharacterized protein n=1 Tax=Fusarium oxysporum f. sp. rapae TaxID=485398 RepID=A0A8J5U266_FUSOX|nr:hypothetical protein Forpe1208_v003466 [Fusarium oxysporum f. sp. rapae]
MPNINIYSWDLMYNTPESGYEIADHRLDTCYEDDLLERNARRQKPSNEEHEELEKQYPPDQWALVIPPPSKEKSKNKHTQSKGTKKTSENKTSNSNKKHKKDKK